MKILVIEDDDKTAGFVLKALKELTASGAIVLLPVGSDDFMKHIADECIYIKREYNVEEMKGWYQELFGTGEWFR